MLRFERALVLLHVLGVIVMITFGTILTAKTVRQEREVRRVMDAILESSSRRDSLLLEVRAHQPVTKSSCYSPPTKPVPGSVTGPRKEPL